MKISLPYLFFQLSLAIVYNLKDIQEPSGRIKQLVILVLENRSFDSFLGHLKRDRPEVDGINRQDYNVSQRVEKVRIDYQSREEDGDIQVENETVGLRSRFKVIRASYINFNSYACRYISENQFINTLNRTNNEVKDKFNPGHTIPDITEQLYGIYNGTVQSQDATMDGFAKNIKRILNTMTFKKQSEKEKRKEYDIAVDSVFGLHSGATLPVHYHLANEYSISDQYFASVPGPTW